jgi:hypothetical protein
MGKNREMTTTSDSARAAVRERHRVRLVEPHEEGSAAADLPRGVYGFTGSAGLAAPLFAARRYRNFEVHHLDGGDVVIVGFVTPADAERLRTAQTPFELTIYPDVEGDATEISAISYSRIARHRQYSIRNTPGLVLHVTPELAIT